ncbi:MULTISPECIES: hypothetical protein [Staphylococcus]|uniref:hypothetical protein n=1 Tax=Staphylococcus TaxID=1279 RepID=UPI000BA630B1|nr:MULTISPECIES: hypothetical protein [Staphylococcus]PAK57185.1 hypothetical protein B9J99_05330 [Staphylococcus capitis]
MNTYFCYLNYNTGQWRNAKSKIINNTKIILEGEEMKDKTYMQLLNIIFVSVALISNLYLIVIFNLTNFLKEEKVSTLIPIIITFFLGVGLKSLYTFFTFF